MESPFDITIEMFGIMLRIFANPHFLEKAVSRCDVVLTEASMDATKKDIFNNVVTAIGKIPELVEETTLEFAKDPNTERGDLFCVLDTIKNLFFYVEVRKGSIEVRTIVKLSQYGIAYASKDVQCAYIIRESNKVSLHYPSDNGEFDEPHPRLKVSKDTHGVDEKRKKALKKSFTRRR